MAHDNGDLHAEWENGSAGGSDTELGREEQQPILGAEEARRQEEGGPRGIFALHKAFQNHKFKGKGHEQKDIKELLKKFEHWAHRLASNLSFKDTLEQVEKLGTQKRIQDSLPDDRSQDTSIPDLIVTMAKRHILIVPAQPSTSKQSRPPPRTNWELCILCQTETDEPLQCPLRSTMKPSGSGYASLTEDLLQFKELRHMPMELNVNRLDDGDGVEATLGKPQAQWHKKCRLKFNKKIFDQQSRAESASGQQSSTGTPTCTHDQQRPQASTVNRAYLFLLQ
ncbi:TIMELESS-interacting protein [Chionoecetes opilio]|uniref:TIMELESS-interacting protein n=1 Tax=Chionoecetes opilio TaxID=41210 RepID=A0A8J4Y1Q0_CHIOP|nr:TIMELESS-interacting protein [Chionoecetes opilio]